MTYDTRAQFNQGLVDSDDDLDPRDRHNGVPHQDRSDDVVDGEIVDPDGEPEHRHDQDGVVHAEQDAARDGEPVEPVDLDGFGGSTEGGHDVATPHDGETPALEDVADDEPDATDDPAHPEAHIGEDPADRADPVVPADEVQDETVAQAVDDDEPVDSETRTLDDLADVEVPADDALADTADRPVDGHDDDVVAPDGTPADEPTPADLAVEDLTTPDATADDPDRADDPVDQPVATDAADLATEDGVQVVGGPDAVDPPPATESTDVDTLVAAASLWPATAAEDLRTRWQAAQLRFVDDPPAVAAELRDLVGEAVRTLQESLADRQRELDGAFGDAGTDTERLRLAVQRYRDFHEQLLER
ncbi:hypothetical protein [Catellatospora sichuanensis]|uniref:hypothetical protein n=1 Tax=Catellatospora sichuanensis TaxID=1969805 RepID=UPI0011832AFA|nr:hypothetical protein [Catellatospora sichuanensis]